MIVSKRNIGGRILGSWIGSGPSKKDPIWRPMQGFGRAGGLVGREFMGKLSRHSSGQLDFTVCDGERVNDFASAVLIPLYDTRQGRIG